MLNKVLNKKVNIELCGGLIAPIIFLAWCFSTIAYKSFFYMVVATFIYAFAMLLYGFIWKCRWDDEAISKKECIAINILITIVSLLLIFIVETDFQKNCRLWAYLGFVFGLIICSKNFVHIFKDSHFTFSEFGQFLFGYKYLILVLCGIGYLALEGLFYPLKWDGLLYYDAVKNATISSLSSLALYGHVSVFAGFVYRLFFSLFGWGWHGMIFANLIMLIISVIAFYGIIVTIFPEKKDWQYSLACLPFGASPFIAGMAEYFSTDWFCVCLITVLIYLLLNKKWLLGSVCSVLFCLTKEPALIAYTGLFAGFVFVDFINIKGSFGDRIKNIFCSLHLYLLFIPYFIWFIIYYIMGPWSAGNGGFGFDGHYFVDKLKVFLIFNFNWIYILTIILTIIYLFIKHRFVENLHWLIPLLCSNFCILLFNCLYKTANHPRYIDSFISVIILLAVILLAKVISKQSIRITIYVGIFLLNVLSCYCCFDPLSNVLFNSNVVGDGILYTTSSLPMGDGTIYNKQMSQIEKPLCDAIFDAIEDGTEIVFPLVGNSIYAINGMSRYINADVYMDELFWDSYDCRRISYNDENKIRAKKIDIYYCDSCKPIENIAVNNRLISIIYVKGVNYLYLDENYERINSHEYNYRGWTVIRDVLVRSEND